jgi:serine/threonine-protein kinase
LALPSTLGDPLHSCEKGETIHAFIAPWWWKFCTWCDEPVAKSRANALASKRLIGQKILDKYEVVRLIGHGGMGSVYEAIDIPSGHRVALKWMHAQEFAADDPGLARFTQEARITGKLDSPHVVTVYELARDPETNIPFHVMELMEGENLSALISRLGAIEPDVAARIAAQACAGLAAAHAAGVVHRDIKPDNIFLAQVDDEIIVKVLDFGIAKIRESGSMAGSLTVPAAPMTRTGQVIGTPLYMAPEQIRGAKHVDARCDVYAMGVTLCAVLAGTPPHRDIKSVAQLLHTLSNAPTVPLQQLAPWVPENLAKIVDKARAKDPADRYADAADFHAALLELLPEGTKIRNDMLVAVPEQVRKVVAIDANTDVNARTAVQGLIASGTIAETLVAAPAKPAAVPATAGTSGMIAIGIVLAIIFLMGIVIATR